MSEPGSPPGDDGRDASRLSPEEELLLVQLLERRAWAERSEGTRVAAVASVEPAPLPARWHLLGERVLEAWQERAVAAWFDADRRGVYKVVTGAGKTILALAAAERLQSEIPDLRVAVVAPTIVLQRQWLDELREHSNLPFGAVGSLGGGEDSDFSGDVRILLCVLASAARKLPKLVQEAGVGDRLLLIVDECHRAGAAEMRRIFDTHRCASLGLSATPERDDSVQDEDDAPEAGSPQPTFDESVLGKELGRVVFQLDYATAIRDGILPPFRVVHYGLTLNPAERSRYEKLSREIIDLREQLESGRRRGIALLRWCRSKAARQEPRAARLLGLTGERKRLLYGASARHAAVARILADNLGPNRDSRAIVFHESLDEVMRLFDELRAPWQAVAEHSLLPDSLRAEALGLFRRGTARVIVSARTLIEGFNVPAADIGLVAASSASVRQRVQTLGRLLRRRREGSEEKHATLYVLYIRDTVDEFLYEKADWAGLIGAERNEYWDWPVLAEAPALRSGPPRSYLPADDEIDPATLNPGDVYPGKGDDGDAYTRDTGGTIRDDEGNLIHATPKLIALLEKGDVGAGRFRVTPRRRYALKLLRIETGWEFRYLGQLDGPLERVQENAARSMENRVFAVGDAYPIEAVRGKTFAVLQRDRRLIAQKVRGGVRFVVPAESIADLNKRAALEAVQRRLAEVYNSGHRINKLTVTPEGHVVYVFDGAAYYLGTAPEREEGFALEEPSTTTGDQR